MEPSGLRPNEATDLAGFCVMVVEDDYFVATEFAELLRARGARVVGPVPDIERGRALLEQEGLDCALLDVNLKGSFVFELAEHLIARGVPTIFTTGYDCTFLPASLQQAPCLQKPIDIRQLVRTIRDQASRAS
jgi:DNA-binding response OmpR family regulator